MFPLNTSLGFEPSLFDQTTPIPTLPTPTPAPVATDPTLVPALAVTTLALASLTYLAVRNAPTTQQVARFCQRVVALPQDGAAAVRAPFGLMEYGLNALGNWLGGRNRPAAAPAPALEQTTQPAAAAATGVVPAPQSAAAVAQQEIEARARFTTAAEEFIHEMNFETITPADYNAFIHAQIITNHQVPLTQMHTIVAQRFAALRIDHVPDFILAMHDETTLQAQIDQAAAFAEERRAQLLERDATLAGSGRFDGEINAAWQDLFTGSISHTEALAKLCHFMVGHGANLTAHESYILSQLHPKHPSGANELKAMQLGVKKMAFGNDQISNQDILNQTSILKGCEALVLRFQETLRNVAEKQAAYNRLHKEREEIAGSQVNPQEETAAFAADSSLAQVAGYVPAAQAARDATKAQRSAQIALVQRFLDGTLDQIYVAPSQNIGGV